MGHYILSFMVYTLAMSGLIFFALFVYKKVTQGNIGLKNSKILSVEETMSISPRKSLMIVKAGEERFLIAADIDKTTLISKLGNEQKTIDKIIPQEKIEHFKNIETEPVDLNVAYNLPENTQEIQEKNITKPKEKTKTAEKKPVHLEVVTDKNLKVSEIRKTQRERKGKRSVPPEMISTSRGGFSTLKEMVHKVNEM